MALLRRFSLRLTRRAVLLSGAAMALPAPHAVLAQAETGVVLLIDRLPAAIDPALVTDLLSRLVEEGIPFGICLPPQGAAQPALAAVIRLVLREFPDLVDPVLRVEGLAGLAPYFQRRAVSDALSQAELWLGEKLFARTVSTDTGDIGDGFDALRLLGIRQVVLDSGDTPIRQTMCNTRVSCLDGAEAFDPASDRLDGATAGALRVLRISLDALATLAPDMARQRIEAMVYDLIALVQSGRAFVSPPHEPMQWLTDGQQVSNIAIVLDSAAPDAGLTAFREAMTAQGLPYTVIGADQSCQTGAPPAAFCRLSPANTAPDGTDIALRSVARPAGLPVFGPDAVVQRDIGVMGADLTDTDGVLLLAASDWQDAAKRTETLARLAGMAAKQTLRLHDMASWVQALDGDDPVFALRQETLRTPPDTPAAPYDNAWRDALMADAARAWHYFETWTDAKTGLCMDTVHVTPDGTYSNGELTMWDCGSLLAAILSAHKLGLIDDAAFQDRLTPVLAHLPAESIGGLRLPPEVISVETGQTLGADFNPCDVGRLLSVLRLVDSYPASKGLARPVVARWDIEAALREGRLQAVKRGRFVDPEWSHCSHYTALALRSWGVQAASPYEVPEMGSLCDWQMRLLLAAGRIGPYGAEPLLLEGVEFGLSPASAFLAQVLGAAQRRSHAQSGAPVCVSEAPLDQSPWFTYQGLVIPTALDRWAVATPSDENAFQTPAFRESIRLVNAKGAYLWAALFPGAYPDLLVDLMRQNATETEIGFNPGYYRTSGRRMAGYTDVNTNGIILQSIAHMLRSQRPAVSP